MELLQTIALLCQINGAGADSFSLIQHAEERQLKCQQYYTKCLGDNSLGGYKNLSKCVKERKL
jgi:hypothetical protein